MTNWVFKYRKSSFFRITTFFIGGIELGNKEEKEIEEKNIELSDRKRYKLNKYAEKYNLKLNNKTRIYSNNDDIEFLVFMFS